MQIDFTLNFHLWILHNPILKLPPLFFSQGLGNTLWVYIQLQNYELIGFCILNNI
jgi:hypothetical protein